MSIYPLSLEFMEQSMTDRLPGLINDFLRLPGEKRAEIFGMLKALTFIQMGENDDALDYINRVNKGGPKAARGRGSPLKVEISLCNEDRLSNKEKQR
jgi:hypothetical protein